MGPHLYIYPAGPWEEGAEQETFPARPELGLWGRSLQSPEGRHRRVARARRQERENPPGKHPEWLISADESLFSFRLNTLNRAPSDVYLHSLRANAGGGPGRLQGHVQALGGLGSWGSSWGLSCCGHVPHRHAGLEGSCILQGGTTLSSTSQPHNKEHGLREYRPHPRPAASPL